MTVTHGAFSQFRLGVATGPDIGGEEVEAAFIRQAVACHEEDEDVVRMHPF